MARRQYDKFVTLFVRAMLSEPPLALSLRAKVYVAEQLLVAERTKRSGSARGDRYDEGAWASL